VSTQPTSRTCSCGATIRFERSEKGAWVPINAATGQSHFLDCPDANKYSGKNR
jgi:hypothetical protein